MSISEKQERAANMIVGGSEPLGYEQITAISGAKGITPVVDASCALVQVEAQAVRWRDDGTDPTPTVGMMLAVGDFFVYTGDVTKIKFIETAVGAIVNVSLYK